MYIPHKMLIPAFLKNYNKHLFLLAHLPATIWFSFLVFLWKDQRWVILISPHTWDELSFLACLTPKPFPCQWKKVKDLPQSSCFLGPSVFLCLHSELYKMWPRVCLYWEIPLKNPRWALMTKSGCFLFTWFKDPSWIVCITGICQIHSGLLWIELPQPCVKAFNCIWGRASKEIGLGLSRDIRVHYRFCSMRRDTIQCTQPARWAHQQGASLWAHQASTSPLGPQPSTAVRK